MKKEFNIKSTLEELGIEQLNKGVCTGTKWLDSDGDVANSYSPADGKLIAGIKQGTKTGYDEVIKQAGKALQACIEQVMGIGHIEVRLLLACEARCGQVFRCRAAPHRDRQVR